MLYKYKAADTTGKITEVLIEGDNEADSLNRLRRRGLVPLQCLGEAAAQGRVTFSLPGGGDFNVYEFTDRLVPLLNAHIPLERALGIIADGQENDRRKEVVNALRRGLHEGKKFSELIRGQGHRFPPLYANLVETGEETGCLSEVMNELQRFLNDSKEMKEFVITSSIYPVIVLTVTIGVVILLFTVFIPRFSKIFVDMGRELPLPTAIMLQISNLFTGLWFVWVLLLAGIVYYIIQVRKGGPARRHWDRVSLRLPLFGKLLAAVEMSRFIRTLAIMIKNHVHLLETVRIAGRVIQNSVMAESFSGVASELRGGTKLSVALRKSPYTPLTAVQMLKVGEESGNIGEMLYQVAEQHEKELKVRIRRLLALFEPAVIVFLAVTVFLVVISIFLAIMEMNEM